MTTGNGNYQRIVSKQDISGLRELEFPNTDMRIQVKPGRFFLRVRFGVRNASAVPPFDESQTFPCLVNLHRNVPLQMGANWFTHLRGDHRLLDATRGGDYKKVKMDLWVYREAILSSGIDFKRPPMLLAMPNRPRILLGKQVDCLPHIGVGSLLANQAKITFDYSKSHVSMWLPSESSNKGS